jgi:hypothetical protein
MPSMFGSRLRQSSLLAVVLLALGVTPSRAAGASSPAAPAGGKPGAEQYLPNRTLLARVNDRRISVLDFRTFYFVSDPQIRPKGDSLGRAEFLSNMVRKEILGLAARSAGYTFNFEDRAALREARATMLSNRLFETGVLDVPPLSDDSLKVLYELAKSELRMRVLQFPDEASAAAARASVLAGRTPWSAYEAGHIPSSLRASRGELTWSRFENVPFEVATVLWKVAPGKYTPVIPTNGVYQVYQVLERRNRALPQFSMMKKVLANASTSYLTDLRKRALTAEAKQGMKLTYDEANIEWVSRVFPEPMSNKGEGIDLHIDDTVPEVSPADTARTLLDGDGGRVSVGRLLHAYSDLPAMMRPSLTSPDRVRDYADALILEPRMVDLAVARGLEQDSVYKARYDRRVESILVEKMVEDSCFRAITVSRQERQAYYEKHRNGFVTFPRVRYAVFVRDTRAAADSVKARLDAGMKATELLSADSLRGEMRSGVQEAQENEPSVFHKLVFEELREGKSAVVGPDRQKAWACVQLLHYDVGHLLPLAEVEGVIDESVRNEKAETALNAFVDRLRLRYDVEVHYELLPRINLSVPEEGETE